MCENEQFNQLVRKRTSHSQTDKLTSGLKRDIQQRSVLKRTSQPTVCENKQFNQLVRDKTQQSMN